MVGATATLLVVVVAVLATSRPAVAHTELASTTPADGETVDTPVSEITLVFRETFRRSRKASRCSMRKGRFVDELGDLTSTAWGKTLLFKVAATVLVAACGAYNRYRILPAVELAPNDAAMRDRARDALAAELALLVVVVALAGVLVGATV